MKTYFQSVVVLLDTKNDIQRAQQLNKLLQETFQNFEMVAVIRESKPEIIDAIQHSFENKLLLNTRAQTLVGKDISSATALWAGIDSAIGDRISVFFAVPADVKELHDFWNSAGNFDAFFGHSSNRTRGASNWFHKASIRMFQRVYELSTGQALRVDQIGLIDLNRHYVNFLHKTRQPEVSLRNSNMYKGFETGSYIFESLKNLEKRTLSKSFGRAMEILFSASTKPLRTISFLALAGAGLNVLYSIYILGISFTRHVSEGWTSMSLQLSGMFFLTSLVLAIICEFLIYFYKATDPGIRYFIKNEQISKQTGLHKKLNISDS